MFICQPFFNYKLTFFRFDCLFFLDSVFLQKRHDILSPLQPQLPPACLLPLIRYRRTKNTASPNIVNTIISAMPFPFSSFSAIIQFSDLYCYTQPEHPCSFFLTFHSRGIIIMDVVNHFEAWLSLVERCVRDAEAAGSNPVASIIIKRCIPYVFKGYSVFLFI